MQASHGTAQSGGAPGKFPPDLKLPQTGQIIEWINTNKYRGTQQPFAEFVNVFERAGNPAAATELKIRAAKTELKNSFCALLPHSFRPLGLRCAINSSDGEDANDRLGFACMIGKNASYLGPQSDPAPHRADALWWRIFSWVKGAVVVLFGLVLWGLANHGYEPQQIVWAVLLTLFVFSLLFVFCFRIVGYSSEKAPDKVKIMTPIFLFDRMLPTYHLREDHYHIAHYFLLFKLHDSRKVDGTTQMLPFLGLKIPVLQASDEELERAERWLDVLKFLGLVFAIFIAAAIARMVR